MIAEAGISRRIRNLAESVSTLVAQVNEKDAMLHGEDLFKATSKTVAAQALLRQQITNLADYKNFMDAMYFLFWEGPGSKLQSSWPPSFIDIRDLRTGLRHDVDHGEDGKVKSKRKRIGVAFARFGGSGSPETMEPTLLAVVQANILSAVEGDLREILRTT